LLSLSLSFGRMEFIVIGLKFVRVAPNGHNKTYPNI
jgi:hypothetical protein